MNHEMVRDYYGEQLQQTADLKTDACCDASALPAHAAALLGNVHEDVLSRYYGCGTVLPEALAGRNVLDLGCGTGRDVYLLAQIVGAGGHVAGVDMTPEQLAVARATLAWHQNKFAPDCPRISFHDGKIEELDALPLAPGSVDVIVSNCVVNLSPDKAAVLKGAHTLLRTGGEMYFADVYADRRVPEQLRHDPVLLGECLSGALYWRDFARLAIAAGFAEPRLVAARPLEVTDREIATKLGGIGFVSATYRLFRLEALPGSEDFGQRARYTGGPAGAGGQLDLDHSTSLRANAWEPVSAETFEILARSRLSSLVDLDPGDGVHRGPFAEPARNPFELAMAAAPASCCG